MAPTPLMIRPAPICRGLLLASLALGSFPGGAATFPYSDLGGTVHTVTVDQLKAIGSAITGYAVGVKRAAAMLLAGSPAAYPPRTVTIA
jgi:hypothetical protein